MHNFIYNLRYKPYS
ncbi:hypothetical protein EC900091_4346, partial [Escherichia coli 90.0091]